MREAEAARRRSHSPYSKFAVGAALLTRGGRIVRGANIENASFGLSVCAERTALWRALNEGDSEFVAIAVTAGTESAAAPCGACRQVLQEFAPDLEVYWRGEDGRIESRRLGQLLAHPFDAEAVLVAMHGPGAAKKRGATKKHGATKRRPGAPAPRRRGTVRP